MDIESDTDAYQRSHAEGALRLGRLDYRHIIHFH